MPEGEGRPPKGRPGARRVHVKHPIRVWFPAFRQPVTLTLKNISLTGMFVVSANPQPPGSVFNFELEIADQEEPLRGRARVEWVSLPGEERGAPPGMGVRFVELARGGYQTLAAAIDRKVAAGAKVTEVRSPRDMVEELQAAWPGDPQEVALDFRGAGLQRRPGARSAGAARAATSGRPDAAAKRASRRRPFGVGRAQTAAERPLRERRRLLLGAGVAVAAIVLLTSWLLKGPGSEAESARAGGGPGAAGPEVAGPAEADSAEQEVAATVAAWARAWSEQRAEEYLAFYSARFVPPGGLDRAAWRRQRIERVRRPEFVRVAVRDLETERRGPDEMAVRFAQDYRSDRYQDTVRKTLVLVREEGGWKISSESVDG